MTTLWDSIKKGLMDGAKIAKEGAQIAAEKAEELGKKSKIMIDISNINRKIEKNFTELGGKVYHLVHEENTKDVSENEEVMILIETINELEKELDEKQKEKEEVVLAIKAEQDARKAEAAKAKPSEEKETENAES